MRILVVEDEPKMAALLRRGLRANGHVADVATTGEDAVWTAQATAYDAIVLDVMLPGIDGLCRRWRHGRYGRAAANAGPNIRAIDIAILSQPEAEWPSALTQPPAQRSASCG